MSESEIMRLWASMTAQRIEIKDLQTELAQREAAFCQAMAQLQFVCHINPKLEPLQ